MCLLLLSLSLSHDSCVIVNGQFDSFGFVLLPLSLCVLPRIVTFGDSQLSIHMCDSIVRGCCVPCMKHNCCCATVATVVDVSSSLEARHLLFICSSVSSLFAYS